jgi:four helix bundle protein
VGRSGYLGTTPQPIELASAHFHVSRILETWKFPTELLGRQLLRSGTSVGAQYREATRAKSNADFISKIEGSLQELEESEYWLELLEESGFCPENGLSGVKKETGELKGIFVSIVRNTKAKSRTPKP